MAAWSEGFVAFAGGIAHDRRDAQAVVALAELPQFSEGVVGCLGDGGEAVDKAARSPLIGSLGLGIAPQQSQGSSSSLQDGIYGTTADRWTGRGAARFVCMTTAGCRRE
jgi:hypothetical protein